MHTLASPDIRSMPDQEFYDLLIDTVAELSTQRQQFLWSWRFDCLDPKSAAKAAGYKTPSVSANQFLRDPRMLRAADLLSERLRREHGSVSADWIVRKYRALLDGAVEDKQWGAARGILADLAKACGLAPEDQININFTGQVQTAFAGINTDDLKAIAQLHQAVLEQQEKEIGPHAGERDPAIDEAGNNAAAAASAKTG